MKGYLERIVARAKAPASGIRPLVRPLFAPASNQPLTEVAREEMVSGAPPSAREPGRQFATQANPDVPRAAESPRVARVPAAREDGGDITDKVRTPAAFTPLMPPDEDARRTSVEGRSADVTTGTTKESAGEIHRLMPQASEPPREAVFQPLMPVAHPARISPAPMAPAPPPPMDEIQIHIGRIEISAVPPAAAPRSVPRRPNPGVSLDDYLRRGRGRAQ